MSAVADAPEEGDLVRVRGQQWVVAHVMPSRQPADELAASSLPDRALVQLTSVSDDDLGEDLGGRDLPRPSPPRECLGGPENCGQD